MKILYEEKGNFYIANVLQKNDKSYQILINDKKVKIRLAKVFFELEKVEKNFLSLAKKNANTIDLDLLWSCCDNQEISIFNLSKLYFNKNPSYIDICAVLIAIYENPIYFNKINRTFFKPVDKGLLEKLKLAKYKKKQMELKIKNYYTLLSNNIIPFEIKNNIKNILYNPDKQSSEYKAFCLMAKNEKLTLVELAIKYNLIGSYDEFLLNSFLIKNYDQNNKNIKISINNSIDIKNQKDIKAFSIDDEQTIEIDDCFSIQTRSCGSKILGIHICLPTIAYDADIEKIILARHSTLYLPNNKKITMLPENWIQQFSLQEGNYNFCMSMYINVDSNLKINSYSTSLDKIFISNNLRIENLEKYYLGIIENKFNENIPYSLELNWLYRFTKLLNKDRANGLNLFDNKCDIYFNIEDGKIKLKKRQRGNPIDLIVSEISILVNSLWAKLLYENNISCIYRTQSKDLNKVKLTTKSSPHYGISKDHYAWFTSPLRRSIDFYNQLSLLKFILNEKDFKFDNKLIKNIISNFEIRNNLYNDFQRKMQLHWSLSYIIQNKLKNLKGVLIKNDLYKILELPMVVRVSDVSSNANLNKVIDFKIRNIDLYNNLIELEG